MRCVVIDLNDEAPKRGIELDKRDARLRWRAVRRDVASAVG